MNRQPSQAEASGSSVDWLTPIRFIVRLPLLLLHLFVGIPLTVAALNSAGRAIPAGRVQLDEFMLGWWSRTALRIFGHPLRVYGELGEAPQFVVANHVSWLDISVLHGLGKMAFVGKAEIRRWPVVGWLSARAGTVFHQRGSGDSLSVVSDTMIDTLNSGQRVAIFPEGRVHDGQSVHRFHARLFRAAIESGAPVKPVAICFYHRDGRNADLPFRDGESFVANIFRLLGQRGGYCQVDLLDEIESKDQTRRGLAEAAHARISTVYGIERNDH